MALITLDEIKQELRISHDAMDDVLTALRDGVLDYLAGYCGSWFRDAASYKTFTDYLPGGGRYLWPHVAPIRSVTSITDRDSDSVVDSGDYRAETTRILRLGGAKWYALNNKYEVIYTAGYNSTDFPDGVKLAALQLMSRVYRAAGGVERESAFSAAVNWAELVKSDIAVMLRPFVYRRPLG